LNKSKLIQILRTFTETEWKEFEKFSSSVYFNKGRNYLTLIRLLEKFYPEFDSDKLTKEYIYEKIFPSKKYNESVIKVMLSGLTSLAEKFLVQAEFEKNHNQQNKFLNDSLIERKLYTLFDSNHKSSVKKLYEDSLRNNSYFYFKYCFEQQRFRKLMHLEKSIYSFDETFLQFDKDLKFYILLELCKFYQPALNQTFDFEVNLKYELFDFLISEIEKDFESCPVTLHCYYFYFKLIVTNETEYFEKLYNSLKDLEEAFERSELRNFYVTLANYIGKSTYRDSSRIKKYFEIIKVLSEKNFLIQDHGYVDPNSLINIANIASDNEDFYKNALNLIETNYQKLRPEIRDDTYNYCNGMIETRRKNFETALGFFSKVHPYNSRLKLNIDALRLTIFYDLKHFENSVSLSDSFVRFVTNHKEISLDLKEIYNDFAKHYKKLLKLTFDNNDADFNLLRINTESKKNLLFKSWFLTKLKEMK